MKTLLFSFSLVVTAVVFSMHQENEKQQNFQLGQALLENDFFQIREILKKDRIDLNKVTFKSLLSQEFLSNPANQWLPVKVNETQYNYDLKNLSPLAFAILKDSIDLTSLLCSYGAQVEGRTIIDYVFIFSRYRLLPVLWKYGFDKEKIEQIAEFKPLHYVYISRNRKDVQKFIAAWVLKYGLPLLSEKDCFGRTSLQAARDSSNMFFMQNTIDVLQNKELLETKMQEVAAEFKKNKFGDTSISGYLEGRKLGMNFPEIKQMQAFKKRQQQQRITSGKEE